MADTRDISAQRAIVTLDGEELPPVIQLEIGNQIVYGPPADNGAAIGPFVAYRPTSLRMVFPITRNPALREIGKDREQMRKDRTITIRWLAVDDDKPLTTTELTNVRFTSVVQRRHDGHAQPVEELMAVVGSVTHND
ncbi:MAG: hypothetical protein IPM29_04515 [Planctomycetes bacterium]|nr:hypothetical protein [Planctomycetota bacterium]